MMKSGSGVVVIVVVTAIIVGTVRWESAKRRGGWVGVIVVSVTWDRLPRVLVPL